MPEAQDKISTLYKYAHIALYYTKEQVRLWRISKLEHLISHDKETVGHSIPGDPGARFDASPSLSLARGFAAWFTLSFACSNGRGS
jgi:hypothetical protein